MCDECALLRLCLCTEKRIQVQQPGSTLLALCGEVYREIDHDTPWQPRREEGSKKSSPSQSHVVAVAASSVGVLGLDQDLA